jgi:hypothetical protein
VCTGRITFSIRIVAIEQVLALKKIPYLISLLLVIYVELDHRPGHTMTPTFHISTGWLHSVFSITSGDL